MLVRLFSLCVMCVQVHVCYVCAGACVLCVCVHVCYVCACMCVMCE